jgi:hypothetical protein
MKRLSCLFALPLLLAAAPAAAAELVYNWKTGTTVAYHYQDETALTVELPNLGAMPGMGGMGGMLGGMGGMPGMGAGGGITSRLKVVSDFTQKVGRVFPDGSAEVTFEVTSLQVEQDGRQLGTLTSFPAEARTLKGRMDRKGNLMLEQELKVYMVDNKVVIGLEAGGTGAGATVEAGDGDERVTVKVFAGVDPKTGQVTASATMQTAPAQGEAAVTSDTPSIEALPVGLLDLLVLPDGDFRPGSVTEVKHPFGTLSCTAESFDAGVAKMRVRSSTSVNTKQMAAPSGKQAFTVSSEEGADSFGMEMEMDVFGGETEEDEAPPMAVMPEMQTNLDADVTAQFDTTRGALRQVAGKVKMKTQAGGVSMKTDSSFSLQAK